VPECLQVQDGKLYWLIATHACGDDQGNLIWYYRHMRLLSPYIGIWPQPGSLEKYAA
jgi:hypothetical protein